MCGIFGYVGTKQTAVATVVRGLQQLEYRGYDSWGVASLNQASLSLCKHVGKISEAQVEEVASAIAIGHTRWATHGAVTKVNAHPHLASDGSFALAQNGICENFEVLKTRLSQKGYSFISQTDTEVIVRLIEDKQKSLPNMLEAVRHAFLELSGRNTILLLRDDGTVIACRNGSPLVLGRDRNQTELYLSSDVLSFATLVEDILVVDNQQLVVISGEKVSLHDIASGADLPQHWEKNTIAGSVIDKEGFPHFMLKEIHENPQVIKRVFERDLGEYAVLASAIKQARTVYTIGSGTAGNAAAQMAYYLRKYGRVPAVSLIGAEASEYRDLFGPGDLIIAPSQSGETADVLEILEQAKSKGVKIASYVNMPGSCMTRISDFPAMAQAGPEVCVVSTKVFVSQIAWGYLVAKAVAGKLRQGVRQLQMLAEAVEGFLADEAVVARIEVQAQLLAHQPHIFLLAKGQNLAIIHEAMVKIIEESYLHAHAIPAGDLKHYAITIMDEGVPVLLVQSNDAVHKDVMNAAHQVQARGAQVVSIGSEEPKSSEAWIPVPDLGEVSAIMNMIPLQLLAYKLGVIMGNNIDRPRNIAKSVTVR